MRLPTFQQSQLDSIGSGLLERFPWGLVYDTGHNWNEVEFYNLDLCGKPNKWPRLFASFDDAQALCLAISKGYNNLRPCHLLDLLTVNKEAAASCYFALTSIEAWNKPKKTKKAKTEFVSTVLFSRIGQGDLFSFGVNTYIKHDVFGINLDNGNRHKFHSNVRVIKEAGSIILD